MTTQESAATAEPSAAVSSLDWRGTARFEVLRCLGRGGMGTVYEAKDREQNRRVALKTLLRFDPSALFLFKQEFRTLAGVHHPNLVRLNELVAVEGERVFFSMELVRGTDFLSFVSRASAHSEGTAPSQAISLPTSAELQSTVQRRSVPPPAGPGASDALGARQPSPADLDRLRPAVRQLVEGLQAVHSAGKLHRDVKPSNVLVTPEGRVVVLDFGVATELARADNGVAHDEGQIVGTARYMAPEQAFEEALTPASDWYSVGVMLYEALVGTTPFSGTALEVIQAKNSREVPAPSTRVDGVPGDLDALCVALLDRDPARRPGGAEILRRMGVARASIPAPSAPRVRAGAVHLVGREAPLHALAASFDAVRRGAMVTVFASGRAGMGKSALLQHFLDGVSERGEAVVLRGRAYERESVPYKAVDAVVDALSRVLLHISDNDGTVVLPRDMDALARLFPVLRRVPAVAELVERPNADPRAVRRRAFGALRELVASLAARRPLVVFIDDVQWGDVDSAALLLDLVRPPQAARVLLLMAHREEDAQTAPFLKEVRARWPVGAETSELAVGPLAPAEARRLSLAILGSNDAPAQAIADAAARESEGSPFLVEELTRSSSSRIVAADRAKVTLDEMVRERLERLPEAARRMAEVVAVGGRPMPLSLVGDAAELDATDDVVATLAMQRFVRTGLRDGREVVEPVHDRIRETVVGLLDEATLRAHHGRLARVLESAPDTDPEAVAVHLLGAGETDRGARFAERAAKRAAKLFAFDQAARLYALTIASLPASSSKVRRMRRRHGEALGLAGRSDEAGRAYLAAAEGAEPAERFDLERVAAQQLLAAGRIEEGGIVLRRVLAEAGVQAPLTPLAAVFWLVMYKLRLKIFGLKFVEREGTQVRPEDHARISALNVGALGLASVDTVLSACLQARQMVFALEKGDRAEVLRAAVIYANHLATRGGVADTHEAAVHALIANLCKTASDADVAYARGTAGCGLFLRGKWREAADGIDGAYANLHGHVAGWQAQAGLYALYSYAFLGDFAELRARHARQLYDADQRGDLFTSVQIRASHPVVLLLAADDAEGARRQTGKASAQWPRTKFLTQHWQIMRTEAEIEVYAGEGAKAYARLVQDERALKRSMLLNVQFIRCLTAFVRARAAVASIAAGDAAQRAARIAEASRLAQALEKEKMPWAAPLATIVAALTKNAAGAKAEALALLERAAVEADAAQMTLYAAAARHQRGLGLGGLEGGALRNAAEETMRAQDIKAPARFASMYVPGVWD
jgi:hypothetical protein